MPPTIQGESSSRSRDRERHGHGSEKRSDYYCCRVKYNNTLPDIPFDPKFLAYPFDMNRYVQYKPTSLERNFKSELLTEHDLGIPIELIDTSVYRVPRNAELDVADERLLEEEGATPHNAKRSMQHAKNVSWLRRTEYISSELGRYGLSNDKAEIKIGASIKKLMKEEDLYRDRDSQINAIMKTFEDAKQPLETHHTKPGVTKVAEYPVFPDFKLWAHPYAQVIFDADPAPKDRTPEEQLSDMSQAMIRGMMDESGDQFVAYFLPTDETCRKRKIDAELGIEFSPEEEYNYKLTREYGWTVKNKASKGYEENYFFVIRPGDGVYYNELETRVRLNKRRKLGQLVQLTNSVLVVKHREFNENEISAQESRLTQLEPAPPEEEEEEEEEDEEQPTENADENADVSGEQGEAEAGNDEDDDEDKEKAEDSKSSLKNEETASSSESSESSDSE